MVAVTVQLHWSKIVEETQTLRKLPSSVKNAIQQQAKVI